MAATTVIYGLHSVRAALGRRGSVAELLLLSGRGDARTEELAALAEAAGVTVRRVERRELDALAGNAAHQGAAARVRGAEVRGEGFLEELLTGLTGPVLLLVLDGVQDPHNLGACLRSADAAGAHAVVVPRDRAVGLNATVRKVASGAAESVPLVQVTNLARTLRALQQAGVSLYGLAGEADSSLFDADLTGSCALVMGAEGSGLRRLTRESCETLLHIPMAGAVESLNVSVAAGICLFEAVRQRG